MTEDVSGRIAMDGTNGTIGTNGESRPPGGTASRVGPRPPR